MNPIIFNYSLQVQENHLDQFDHVNNATYLIFFEEARWDLLNKNGYDLQKIKATGLGPTILEIHLKFLKELRLHDEIIIETQLISYHEKIGKLSQIMLRHNEHCCSAEFVIGLFNLKERKLVKPTQEWLNVLGFNNQNKT